MNENKLKRKEGAARLRELNRKKLFLNIIPLTKCFQKKM